MGQVAAREKPRYGPVDGHGLVAFILDGEGMCHAHPGVDRGPVQGDRLLEIFAGQLVLLSQVVVTPHCEPCQCVAPVVLYQVMSAVVELAY